MKYNGKKIAGTILRDPHLKSDWSPNLTSCRVACGMTRKTNTGNTLCVLGHDTWDELFGDQYAIGKEVNIETGLYTVIGVLDKQKQPFGGGKNPRRQHRPTSRWARFTICTPKTRTCGSA